MPDCRRATREDLPQLGEMGAALARMHYEFDPRRFLWNDGFAQGYARWFGRELANADAFLGVIEGADGGLAGYVYGRLEGKDWQQLLDEHAALVDVYVRPEARGAGSGAALVKAFCAWSKSRGAPRVVLSSAAQNTAAQVVFEHLGFRRTMVEMTRESD